MKVKQNLKRNKRILESLLELRRPHRRMLYCQKPTPRMAKWWVRRLRKREEKRRQKLEKMHGGKGRKKKLTQRELKQQNRKDALSQLSKGIKLRIPHFRMLYKTVNISGPLASELQLRKHIKKRKMLARYKKEHKLLCSEINFLISPSVEAETKTLVETISRLTQEKMFWDQVFNDVKALLQLFKNKIAENGTILEKLRISMNKAYFERKNQEKYMVTQPTYFEEIEYNLYQEKKIHTRKSIKERYLEDLAEIEGLFMALEKKGEEVNHYLRTRELFVSVLDKILNRLNRGKRVVLDFLQDGHDLMNNLTLRILDLMSMKKLTEKIEGKLSSRKREALNERAMMVQGTKDLMARHRPTLLSATYQDVREGVGEAGSGLEEVRARVAERYEVFLKAILVFGGFTHRGSAAVRDFTEYSRRHWVPEHRQFVRSAAFLMQKITFPLIETEDYRKRAEIARNTILAKKQLRRDLKLHVMEHRKQLEPILEAAREARYRVRSEYLRLYKTWKYFMRPFRDLYGLLNKKASYNSNKLGIHNRMTEFNKVECLNELQDTIPFYVAKLVHSERYAAPRTLPFNSILRKIDRERMKWQRFQLLKILQRPQTKHLRKKKFYEIKEHPPLHSSPCPLCTVEERLSKMALVEEFEDKIRSVYEIQSELRDTQEMADLKALNHPIWECNQPAARSLIQLLILEDRQPGQIMDFTKMAQ